MDRRCADAVSGIARRTASSGPRNQHSEVMSVGLGAAHFARERRDGRKPDPPICTPFYAIALPPVEGTLHTPRIARRSVLRATRERRHRRASEPVTKGSTEQQLGSENRRPNYAVAVDCPFTPTQSSPAAST
jgi:hypothetical protein